MNIHAYSEEDFGCLVAFTNGKVGLYDETVLDFLKHDASHEECQPYKLKKLVISDNFHLKSPLITWLELTRRCNLECKHCFAGGGQPAENELSTAELVNLLDNLRAKNTFSLVFSGGEPLLHNDFLSIFNYARKLKFVITLVTNGVLLTEDIIKQLPTDNFRLTISIDGFSEHSRLRGNVETKPLLDKLLLLKKYNIPCNVSSTMTADNIFELEELFTWLIKHEITFRTIPFSPLGRGASHSYLQLGSEHVVVAAKLWEMEIKHEKLMRSKVGLTFSTFYDFALNLVYMARRCKGGRSVAYIKSTGDVYPCTTCVGANMFAVGNIRELSFEEIWERSFDEFRKITWEDYEVCKECLLSSPEYFCTNRCPPLAKIHKDDMFSCGSTLYDRASLKLRTDLLQVMDKD